MSGSGTKVRKRTTEQLKRKREFDKENQRIFRERKKIEFAALKTENEDLKGRLEVAQREIKDLTQSRDQLMGIIQNATSLLQTAPPYFAPTGPSPAPSTSLRPSAPPLALPQDFARVSTVEAVSPCAPSVCPSAGSDAIAVVPSCSPMQHDISSINITEFNSGLIFDMTVPPEFTSELETPDYAPYDQIFDASQFTLSLPGPGPLMPPGTGTSGASGASNEEVLLPETADSITRFLSRAEALQKAPRWARVPTHINATCRLDASLLAAVQAGRQSLSSGQVLLENFETSFPSIGSLLNPQNQSITNPISSAVGEHGKISLLAAGLPERLGLMYNMCLLVRWLVSPTKENWEAMPGYVRPTENQIKIPHPMWIDTVPWPEARELYLKEMDWNGFERLRAISLGSVSVNWHSASRLMVKAVSKTELTLDDAFIQHVRDLRNWTIGKEVANEFTFLKKASAIFRPE